MSDLVWKITPPMSRKSTFTDDPEEVAFIRKSKGYTITEYRTAPAHPAQPVAFSVGRTLHWHEGNGITDAQLYANPAGDAIRDEVLNDDQIEDIWAAVSPPFDGEVDMIEYAREIESAVLRALRGRAG